MSIIPDDECCGPRLSEALLNGYDAMRWECPECGSSWEAEVHRMDAGEATWQWKYIGGLSVFAGTRRIA